MRKIVIQAEFQVVSCEEEWIMRSITKIGSTRKRASLGKKILSSVSITLNFKYFDLVVKYFDESCCRRWGFEIFYKSDVNSHVYGWVKMEWVRIIGWKKLRTWL